MGVGLWPALLHAQSWKGCGRGQGVSSLEWLVRQSHLNQESGGMFEGYSLKICNRFDMKNDSGSVPVELLGFHLNQTITRHLRASCSQLWR